MASPDLSRRVDRQAEDLRVISDTVIETHEIVQAHTETLAELGRTVAEQGRTLDAHTRTLAEHGDALTDIQRTLSELVTLMRGSQPRADEPGS